MNVSNNIKVSIIVPVYNAEKYLKRCMDSLLNQTMKDIEIILVDDGSTDKSGVLCDNYLQYSNIKVIHQDNSGISGARKAGVAIACGEYFTFVDADDYVSCEMCLEMYMAARESGARIVLTDLKEIRGININTRKGYRGSNLTIKNFYLDVTPCFLCSKLFHSSLKSFWENFNIQTNQAEDMCVVLPIVSYLKKDSDLFYLERAYYYYYRHEDSNSADDYFISDYCIIEYLNALRYIMHNHNKEYSNFVSYYCMNAIYWGLNNKSRGCFRADYLEFITEELMPYVIRNQLFSRFNNLLKYISCEIIPKTIVYSKFDAEPLSEIEKKCIDSWKKNARDYDIVELTIQSVDLENAPPKVQEAIENKDFSFAEDYFKLKYLYEHGGIGISTNIKVNKPLGAQRANKLFFAFGENNYIDTDIFGGCARNEIFAQLIDFYETDSLYKDSYVTLNERTQILLEGSYGLTTTGKEQHLAENVIAIYPEKVMYKRIEESNISCKYSVTEELAEKENKVLVDADYISRLLEEGLAKNNQDEIDKLKRKIDWLQEELEIAQKAYQNTIESKAWKMTAPVRRILDSVKS